MSPDAVYDAMLRTEECRDIWDKVLAMPEKDAVSSADGSASSYVAGYYAKIHGHPTNRRWVMRHLDMLLGYGKEMA